MQGWASSRRVWSAGAALAVVMGLGACTNGAASKPASPASTVPASHARAALHPATGPAAGVLDGIPVKVAGSKTGYSRAEFGPAWTDNNGDSLGHNGCDTRDDILKRDLTHITYKSGHCTVQTGTLLDPYTGKTIHFTRGAGTSTAIQIDHAVALGSAWTTGARNLTAVQRVDLANDPLELLAADGPANESKGDRDAASWLPANRAFRCQYVADQIAVKAKYRLWVTAAEKRAMIRVLQSCPGQRVGTGAPSISPSPTKPRATPTHHSTPTHAPQPATHAPAPAPRRTTPPPTGHGPFVHPGAFCAPEGATGVTDRGTPMVCGPASDGRNRWHHAP